MAKCMVIVFLLSVTTAAAQNGWESEGSLQRWFGTEISSQYLGSTGVAGDPVVETGGSLLLVPLDDSQTTKKDKPEGGGWLFLPRVPQVVAKVSHSVEGGGATTISFNDVWLNKNIAEVTAMVSTDQLLLDPTDTWVSADGSQGCVVFSPVSATPEEAEEYVIIFFADNSVTFIQRIKPKVDVDIYIRPHDEKGVIAYVRGNGISFPPNTQEVFTNASYLTYEPDGNLETISLPIRGPGSGKGRRIIWHSNKWDRILLTDEFASGALLVKASNGIVVDSIVKSEIDPGPVKILSASGNNNDRWMATHARVGDKNSLILWAMPDTREVASIQFSNSDVATKQMPLSPWSIVIPFISSGGNGNALYSWNSQDVVSVQEYTNSQVESRVWPLPAKNKISVSADGLVGGVKYFVMNATGTRLLNGSADITQDVFDVEVSSLTAGVYVLVAATPDGSQSIRTRFVISD